MTDIDVVPKKRGAGWVTWLIVALVALAVIWMLMGRTNAAAGSSRDQGATDNTAAVELPWFV